MKCSFVEYPLVFKRPFGVSKNTRTYTDCIIVKLEYEGFTGFGEATLPPYLEENISGTLTFLKKFKLSKFHSLPSLEEFNSILNSLDHSSYSAKAALDIAFHDLIGKIDKKSISEMYNIKNSPNKSSFTIGLDQPNIMIEKIQEAYELGFEFIKIKMGTKNDQELFKSISKYLKSDFSIDANQGWLDKIQSLELCSMFNEKGAAYIEQPFEKNNLKDSAWLSANSPIPIMADESCKSILDIELMKDCFHGINIKLMKCGGLYNAFKMFEIANDDNLKTIAGCMAESSCGVSAMSHLSPLANWVDLDAPNLIKNDPFEKILLVQGVVSPPKKYGIGTEKLS